VSTPITWTQLDAAIGDADHGINMSRGFTAAVEELDGFDAGTVGEILVRTGNTLVSRVGGAAGPALRHRFPRHRQDLR
jgi:dihydroxyacetone kinase-like protein